jgi:hypothetical protein
MRFTLYLVLMGIAGALFLVASIGVGFANINLVALGLAFMTAAFVADRYMESR